MDRAQKREAVATMNDVFAKTACLVVTHYSGLNVAEMTDLRRRMKAAGATLKVTKNRLTKLALDGTPYSQLSDLFEGPTAIAYADDPVAVAKVAVDFAKGNDKLKVLGAGIPGQTLRPSDVETLAKLPSLDELRGKLVGLLQAPASKIVGVLQAPGGQLARVLQAYADKQQQAA